jgi:membrane-bound ClpP family serine protease
VNFAPAFVAALLFLILPVPAAQALHADAQAEIEYLLGYMEKSGYRFFRSGQQYNSAEGAEHMRMKLNRAGGRVKSADDFVRAIASKSFLTGDPYLVRAPDGRQWQTGEWLEKALVAYRKTRRP